ncbi:YceD family protein [Vandammella animalimorsus]|nr:DUF177 domain-containing protein [Vandammella animalimorsus]
MEKNFNPRRLDVLAFAQAGGQISQETALHEFPRLARESLGGFLGDAAPAASVHWQAQASMRRSADGQAAPWLHCQAQTILLLQCQRCLQPVPITVSSDQWFRFVATEAQAEAEDEDAQEDVLSLESGPLDLLALIEDDLLMALPPVAKHADCTPPAPLVHQDAAFDAAQAQKRNPFAQLAHLATRPLQAGNGGDGGEQAD